jgi:diadenosine tetraphosphate (Ap4A) HIT family hydrolase
MDGCFFCDGVHDEFYGDDRCFVMLHEDWAVRGHAMVVWRGHVENISDLAGADAAHFLRVYGAAEHALLATTGAERAIILKLGIQTPHLHLHIYPVPATASRAEVMAAIEGKTREKVDPAFVASLRQALDSAMSAES